MDLTKILAISGKPGLFKVLGQTQNNGIIVESLIDGKRFPAYAAHKLSSLEDISIYTEDDDVPLREVFQKIYEKEEGKKSIDPNVKGPELRSYFSEILPDFDQDRVYNSDIKKVIRWYNDLHEAGLIEEIAAPEKEEASTEKEEEKTEKKAEKKQEKKASTDEKKTPKEEK